MISKLPRWVWSGAWVLSFIAGSVNVVGLLSMEHRSLTHMTGNTSQLAASLASLDFAAAGRYAAILGSFVVGAMLSGVIIQDSTLQLGRRYGVALFLESLLLCLAAPLMNHHHHFCGLYIASCACGLQNAMVSTYSGTVVRTTHVSGMYTDLGIFLGHVLRGLPVDSRRARLCFLVISGFFCGGAGGCIAFRVLGFSALFIPAGLTVIVALAYWVYRIRKMGSAAFAKSGSRPEQRVSTAEKVG